MERFMNDDIKVHRTPIAIPCITKEQLMEFLVQEVKRDCYPGDYEEMVEDCIDDEEPATPENLYHRAVSLLLNCSNLFREEEWRDYVDVDHENWETEVWWDCPEAAQYLDIQTIDGITFCGVITGGDWEWPLYEILYWDGTRIRPYIPTRGNLVNPYVPCAFGSEGGRFGYWLKDLTDAGKRMKERLERCGCWPEFTPDPDEDEEDFDPCVDWGELYVSTYGLSLEDRPYNWEVMWDEIRSVLKPR